MEQNNKKNNSISVFFKKTIFFKKGIFQAFFNKKGLSLIEMLVVVAILAFIMSILGRSISQNKKKSQINQTRILIGLFQQAMEEFNYDCGYYPNRLEELVSAPSDCEEWGPQPYLKNGKIPKDPWGKEFQYDYNESTDSFVITSFGADRAKGGSGRFTKDISSRD